MTEAQIDGPVREMIDATNAEDRDRLLQAFAPNAVLIDFGRRFVGREEIGGWSDRENIGTHNRIAATNISTSPEGVDVEIEVTGDGYNGTALLRFALDGAQITTLGDHRVSGCRHAAPSSILVMCLLSCATFESSSRWPRSATSLELPSACPSRNKPSRGPWRNSRTSSGRLYLSAQRAMSR